ncbi:KTSC domain-containing protein [Bradyrhizobium guangxiense]
MERYNVASSNVQSIGYEPQSGTLEVEFVVGTVYQYYGVPQNIYDQLMQEPSKGRFLNTYIKNQYPYSRVG